MAATPQISTKRLAISKANAQMVAIVAVAAFVTVFCLVAAKTVFSQNSYQAKVVTAKEKALNQLKQNIQTYHQLSASYNAFDKASSNVIGGNAAGTGDNDGPNSKIIIDALPSNYDFPALTASIEKILDDSGLKVSSITGIDDQINQQGNTSSPSPQAVPMPFGFTINSANYLAVGQLVNKLQTSIRPMQIDNLELSGGVNDMTLVINAHTYYQPAKSVSITKKVIK